MVLGAISATRKSPLVIIQGRLSAQRYVDDVLRPVLIPFINQHQNVMTFQHDGHHTLQGSPIFSSLKTTSVSCQSRTLSQHEPFWACLGYAWKIDKTDESKTKNNARTSDCFDWQVEQHPAAWLTKTLFINEKTLHSPDYSKWQSHPLLTFLALYFSSINNRCYLKSMLFRFESFYL